jgi:hypothetical protein
VTSPVRDNPNLIGGFSEAPSLIVGTEFVPVAMDEPAKEFQTRPVGGSLTTHEEMSS